VQSLVDDAVIIEFNTERDRMRGMAVLMRDSELFRSAGKYRFKIRSKDLPLFEAKKIRFSVQRM
jgi:hypothetical protein